VQTVSFLHFSHLVCLDITELATSPRLLCEALHLCSNKCRDRASILEADAQDIKATRPEARSAVRKE
jgi:hypothetical protein